MLDNVPAYRLTAHAVEELERRKLPLMILEMVLSDPEVITRGHDGRYVYQSRVNIAEGKQALLRVIVEQGDVLVVVTVYYTTKVEKYWSDA